MEDWRVRQTWIGIVCLAILVVLAGCAVDVDVGDAPGISDDGTTQNDSDGDGLDDSFERQIGTDPNDPDTDGDRLPDGWEYHNETDDGAPLPDADPLHKDIYAQVSYAQGIPPLTEAERRNLTAIFAGMNVTNPDGERGIDLHVDDEPPHGGRVDVSRTFTSPPFKFMHAQYERYLPENRQCVYHGTTFVSVDLDATRFGGVGERAGYRSVIVGQLDRTGTKQSTWGTYTSRVDSLVHELLHNVAGNVTDGPDPAHTGDEGWLAHSYIDPENRSQWTARYERLATPTRRKLTERGFVDPSDCDPPTDRGAGHVRREGREERSHPSGSTDGLSAPVTEMRDQSSSARISST